jgi:ATP-dependent Clp protease ATP-binding subunit ClpC
MFERYTEAARRVLFFARYEASQLGGTSIDPDHVLLGLTREAKGIICEIFAGAHVSLKGIRNEIEARARTGLHVAESVEIPFTDETKRVLEFAGQEADGLHHNYVGTEHLLLGLLREATCPAALTLAAHGLRLADIRTDIVKLTEPGTVLGLPTHSVEADEHVERIKRLVVKLAETPHDDHEAKQLTDRIIRELDALKRRLAG